MKIGIVGLGFVGLSFAAVLASKSYSVIGMDCDELKIIKIKNGKVPFYEPKLDRILKKALNSKLTISSKISSVVDDCKLIFVTVGTPQLKNGNIDLSKIKLAMKEIGKYLKKTKNNPVIIIKSTVVPGTTKNVIIPFLEKISKKKCGEDFGVITNPEFLRESRAVDDTIKPHAVVLGSDNNKFLKKLKNFYLKFYRNVPTIITNYQTAELIKYTNNVFLATKISFINQIANICQAIPETNIDDVAKAIGLDPRIGKLFLSAGPGYGGSCLPKDVKALTNFASTIGVKPILLNAVEEVNKNQIKNIITLIENAIGNVKHKNISILGIAFKPETDDVRDSVSINLIKTLLKKGVRITLHDPKAIENAKKIFGEKIFYAKSIRCALKNTHCCVIMTPWKHYSHIQKADLKMMKKRVIIDSRRMLIKNASDVDYHAVGIST